MASLLRQIVASPRVRHEETGLDLVYVTDNIIAMSMPASEYPKVAYRNPLKKVVEFLDKNHGDDWAVWEFRAEGTGYSDSAFHDRVFHSPWPDHHPPPFGLIPNIMASMRNHLKSDPKKVAVVHCKAGKGRTGTVTCSYLISEEGYSKEDALKRFTQKRMRPQFGEGVSIPSQLRYVDYVTQWVGPKYSRTYVERSVEILEVHLWELREGIRLSIMGFVDEGKVIKEFHLFHKNEKTVVDSKEGSVCAVFRPKERVVLPTNDVCIDLEKRTKAAYGWTIVRSFLLLLLMPILRFFCDDHTADKIVRKLKVSSLAHCWFNCFFEGDEKSGVFEQEWEKMDGIKGTSRKGAKMFDKIMVVWKVVDEEKQIQEPSEGEPVEGTKKAPTLEIDKEDERDLGLRKTQEGDFSDAEDSAASGTATPKSLAGKPLDESSLSTMLNASSIDSPSGGAAEGPASREAPLEDPKRAETAPASETPHAPQAKESASAQVTMPKPGAASDTPPDPGQITEQPRTASPESTPTSTPGISKILNQAVSSFTDSMKKNAVGMVKRENEDEMIS